MLVARLVRLALDPPPLVPLALVVSSWMVPTVWTNVLKVPLFKATVNVEPVRLTAVPAVVVRILV